MITLVTGATGLVGNNVVRLLLDERQPVRALVRADCDPRPLADLDVEFAEGDIRDAESLTAAMRDVSRVVHAAAMVHIGRTGLQQQRAVNVEGTRNVCQAALDAGARMVHVSSVDALRPGTREDSGHEEAPAERSSACPYVVTKGEAEEVVQGFVADGLDAVIINPAYMLGPWDWKPSSGRMLLAVAKRRPLLAPPGGNDFCDVRDVAAGILAAMERGKIGRRYILGGEPLSYYDAWHLFATVCGSRGPIRVGRRPILKFGGLLGDLWGKIAGREGDLNSVAVALAIQPHHYTYARAEAELDYHPRPAQEAVRDAWSWFQEHGYA